MAATIVGLFTNPEDARAAVADLEAFGIGHEAIGFVGGNAQGQHRTLTGENVTSGVEAGALAGGATGFLLGAVGLAVPVVGPVVAAGVLAATLAGAGVGAVAGGLIGALVHVGVPADVAPHYAEGVRQGGTVLTVHAPEGREEAVRDVFARRGAATELPPAQIDDIPDSERTASDPIHLGPTGTRTQISDGTITEIAIGEESLPR